MNRREGSYKQFYNTVLLIVYCACIALDASYRKSTCRHWGPGPIRSTGYDGTHEGEEMALGRKTKE